MTKTKSATANKTKPMEKSSVSNASQKHSVLFYISPSSLFNNKRLKQKRSKLFEALRQYNKNNNRKKENNNKNHNNNNNRREKTVKRFKPNLSALQPDITIDLISDDDEEKITRKGPPPLVKIQTSLVPTPATQQNQLQPQQQLQHLIVYPSQLELAQLQLSNSTNLRLISLPNVSLEYLQQRVNVKRKRKCHQPQRHAQPTIVNNESIVLTDESDTDTNVAPHVPLESTPTIQQPCNPSARQPLAQSTPSGKSSTVASPPRIAHVDEEVTVSLVPRSSTAGSCSKSSNNEQLFPMLPDETTVHTVIANRIYELSLTKLREGLASCGIPEFNEDKPQHKPPARRTKVNPPASAVPPQPGPISLKLSSDLSISLISDDDDDGEEQKAGLQLQQLNAEKLLQQQPHLAVQQVRMPVTVATDARQIPRRRKLG